MRRLAEKLVVFAMNSCCAMLPGQTAPVAPAAVVTFYAGGSLLKTALPTTKSAVFSGCIFDGQLMVGCITHLGFVAVRATPGAHVFSASLSSKHPAKNSHLEMTLEPGRNYFVRAVGEVSAFKHVVGARQGRLDLVSCDIAHDETRNSSPMEDKQLGPAYKAAALPDIPACTATP